VTVEGCPTIDSRPDAIVPQDAVITLLFKAKKTSIPIIAIGPDPVPFGLVKSIAHPGGNITGISIDAGLGVWGKRYELLKEAVPKLTKVCQILPMRQKSWEESPYAAALRDAAKPFDIVVVPALLDGKIDEAAFRRVFRLASNLINNLPMGLIAATTTQAAQSSHQITGAVLIGVDLGPNLSVTGSLATILWLIALRREGEHVGALRFLQLGVLVMPPALVLSLLALSLIAP
jgi:hypothetical protein